MQVITRFVFQLARGKKTHRTKPSTRPPPRSPDWFSQTCSAVLYRLFLRWPKALHVFFSCSHPLCSRNTIRVTEQETRVFDTKIKHDGASLAGNILVQYWKLKKLDHLLNRHREGDQVKQVTEFGISSMLLKSAFNEELYCLHTIRAIE